MRFSNSSLSTFEQCPQKFKFQYIDKLDAEGEEGIEAFVGSRVHETLKKLYASLQRMKKLSLNDLVEYYGKQWKKNWSKDIKITRKEFSVQNSFDYGVECLNNYFNSYNPFNQGITLGLEKKIRIPLSNDSKYTLVGFIDRLTESNGVYEIHDYKTSAFPPEQEILDRDRQLALYQLGVHELWPEAKDIELVWHYLRVNKEFRSKRSKEHLRELKDETIKLIDFVFSCIDSERFPTKESQLCDWCGYFNICPAKKHLWQTMQLEPEKFLADDGVKLANKFIELHEVNRLASEELDAVKKRILNYAVKNNFSSLTGSNHRLNIWSKEVLKLPGRTDPEREQLESLMKASGKWLDFSSLDSFALEKALQDETLFGKLSPELKAKLLKLSRKELIQKIYIQELNQERDE
jgi:CRISPR/Cas system-associated exonuclease Cas4 (RecB family)